MKKLLPLAACFISVFPATAQTCTLTGTGTIVWPTNGTGLVCMEDGGTPVGKTTLVIPAGLTVVFDNNEDTWTGAVIEVQGVLQITANPVIKASIRVKDGGSLDLVGKLSIGTTPPAGEECGYSLLVDAGGTVTVGSNAADRLSICGADIMKGAAGGQCNDCGGTNSGQCPYNGKPYCQPAGGFTGPSGYDDDGYDASLPVKLLFFDAIALEGMISVQWATSMEENFYQFLVQRSSDGLTFEDIGAVEGQGFNIYDIESKYSFLDEAPLLGMNYYRLKAVDLDNSYEYSAVKAVKMNGPKRFTVYPNPSNGVAISFRTNFSVQESDRIFLIDQLGEEVFSAMTTSNEHTIVFENALKPGVYMLRYVSQGFEQVSRVVVTR